MTPYFQEQLGCEGSMSQHDTLAQALQQIADWNSHTTEYAVDYGSNGVRDFYRNIARAALATPAQAQQPPYAWAVSGASTMFFGPTAEYDARQEAKHCGGTAEAFPLFRDAQAQQAGEPYAYAVYFPDQPTEVLVHDLDELIDSMTNREHTVTKLYATTPPAPAQAAQQPAGQQDTAALNWIERQHLEELGMGLVIDAPNDGQYYVCGDSGTTHYGKTLREALASAMTEEA